MSIEKMDLPALDSIYNPNHGNYCLIRASAAARGKVAATIVQMNHLERGEWNSLQSKMLNIDPLGKGEVITSIVRVERLVRVIKGLYIWEVSGYEASPPNVNEAGKKPTPFFSKTAPVELVSFYVCGDYLCPAFSESYLKAGSSTVGSIFMKYQDKGRPDLKFEIPLALSQAGREGMQLLELENLAPRLNYSTFKVLGPIEAHGYRSYQNIRYSHPNWLYQVEGDGDSKGNTYFFTLCELPGVNWWEAKQPEAKQPEAKQPEAKPKLPARPPLKGEDLRKFLKWLHEFSTPDNPVPPGISGSLTALALLADDCHAKLDALEGFEMLLGLFINSERRDPERNN